MTHGQLFAQVNTLNKIRGEASVTHLKVKTTIIHKSCALHHVAALQRVLL